ncbi:MAG: glycosyltransferase family 4 protein [Verrucomicrobia bacterium]|nr:glycosyltransferase family 4 protein [Verrucomicrobiota bacterium]
MKIVFLTAGTGSYHCGACMRDNALARELHRAGHDVTLAPMYLPLILDEETLGNAKDVPVFFGGINVFLQQKLALFRHTPAWLDRLFNSTGLLKWAARHSHMTSARDQGEMTLEMLDVGASRLRKELDKLMEWLAVIQKPDVVCLSNALLAGFIPELKRRLGAPVVTFFQGEDTFLDGLPEPFRAQCWDAMRARVRDSDQLLAPTRYYADFMTGRLNLAPAAIEVLYNGIQLVGYAPAEPALSRVEGPPAVPTIGYLARLSREKGLGLCVDAFLCLTRELGDTKTHLHLGGAATAGDEPFIAQQKQRLAAAGLAGRVTWSPNLSRDGKVAFLRGLTLFSVPVQYPEAFGLYLLEAMACGVPVVQPDAAAFPELVAATGGGICVPPRDPLALANAWKSLLADPARRTALGQAGRLSIEKRFNAPTMAAEFLRVTARLAPAAA